MEILASWTASGSGIDVQRQGHGTDSGAGR
jgi:hypothetical protein